MLRRNGDSAAKRTLVCFGVAAALGVLSSHAGAESVVLNKAVQLVGAGAPSDPLIAVEANRTAIINRLAADYGDVVAANGVPLDVFRAALEKLRADQLLAAALVGTAEEVTSIVEHPAVNGASLQRFVPLSPMVPQSMADLPAAEAYLMREADMLTVVKATDVQLGTSAAQLVGYFAPATTTTVVSGTAAAAPITAVLPSSTALTSPGSAENDATASSSTRDARLTLKDGPGSGAGSWIGTGPNIASGQNSAVGAGANNQATNFGAAVFAGNNNTADGVSSLVIGGFDNHATTTDTMVGGGAGNRATGARAVVVGGGYNLASGDWSYIGGGGRFNVSGLSPGNFVEDHLASGRYSTIAGGQGNKATGLATTISGGQFNRADGDFASVAGGTLNSAAGLHSAALGGFFNTAAGIDSVAIGCSANASHHGAILVSATTTTGTAACGDPSEVVFDSAADNEFAVRATGGVRMVSAVNGTTGAPTAGVTLGPGASSWSTLSDRAAKDDLTLVPPRTVLEKLMAMPIYTWRYKTEVSRALHMGPTAQDFRAAFGLGDSDKTITTIDEGGVAFAAIKGLKEALDEKNAEISALRRELNAIKRKLGIK